MGDSTAEILLTEFRELRRDIAAWQQETGERVATLEAQVKDVVGNGRPGRLAVVEGKVSRHSRVLWIGSGVLLAVNAAVGVVLKLWPAK